MFGLSWCLYLVSACFFDVFWFAPPQQSALTSQTTYTDCRLQEYRPTQHTNK